MARMEPEESDFRTLLNIFLDILNFCEGQTSSLDVESVFKSAEIVENACSKLESLGVLNDFENKLSEFLTLKGLNLLPIKFFKNTVNEVLCRYITDGNFSDTVVKCAINQFILIRSKEDFVNIVKHLNHTHHSVELLKQTCDVTGIFHYNAEVLLGELTKQLVRTNGNVDELDSTITNFISNNKDSFKVFLKVLCLINKCELSQCIQNLIAINISNLINDPGNENLYRHFIDLSDADFGEIVVRWKPLSETFIKMIKFSVEHLKCDYSGSSYTWCYPGSEKGLTFEIIIALINKLKYLPETNEHIQQLLHNSKKEGFEVITEDLLRICKLNR